MVREEQAKLEKILPSMPWQSRQCIYMRDNGRLLPGMNPNPRREGAVSLIGPRANEADATKRAAELILIGNHDLCNEQEVADYEAAQAKARAEAGMASAARRGTITFAPPTSASSDPGELAALKARIAALEGGAK
jgi:hypothetical protein